MTTTHYCITCKWYKDKDYKNQTITGYCNLLESSGGEAVHPLAGAFADDYESYNAFFMVNKNTFGCLCHSNLRPELLI